MKVMTFEEFASLNGASRLGIGEAALHRSSNAKSSVVHRKQVNAQFQKDAQLIELRDRLREEFDSLVANGEIREPSPLESLKARANGHPDNQSTQAARRLLVKRGIDWNVA
jgi:hypothetical protein